MPERPDFQEKQYAFAAHIRDPDNVPAPEGIENRRMAIYRKLFFNNLANLLATMFPVIRKIKTDEQWRSFLQTTYKAASNDEPFLVELAHYEYAELALSVSTAEDDMNGVDPDGDLLAEPPVKSVLSWVFAYHYPVHRISPEFLPSEPAPQPVYLALYRDSNDKVRFLELNAITAGLLDAVENNEDNKTGEALLRELAESIHYHDVDALIRHGADALNQMRQLQILIGTRR